MKIAATLLHSIPEQPSIPDEQLPQQEEATKPMIEGALVTAERALAKKGRIHFDLKELEMALSDVGGSRSMYT